MEDKERTEGRKSLKLTTSELHSWTLVFRVYTGLQCHNSFNPRE